MYCIVFEASKFMIIVSVLCCGVPACIAFEASKFMIIVSVLCCGVPAFEASKFNV